MRNMKTEIRSFGLALAMAAASAGSISCDRIESLLSGSEAETAGGQDTGGLEMSASRTGDNWHIAFLGFLGRPSNLVVRFGEKRTETFRGPSFQLPADVEGPIEITLLEYELHGEVVSGPFRFEFDPKEAHVSTAKHALDQMRADWVSWRRYAGKDILQLGVLNSLTCGIDHVDYGFDDQPDQRLPLQECEGEYSSTYSALKFEIDEKTHVVLQVTFADGAKTTVHRFPNPNHGRRGKGPSAMNRALITSDTSGAKVHVDGEYRCDAPCEVKVPVDGYEHEIRLEKEGYEDLVKSWKPDGVADPSPKFGPMTQTRIDGSAVVENGSDSPESSGPASSWVEAVLIVQPCWELEVGPVSARTLKPPAEAAADASRHLSVEDCKRARERVRPVFEDGNAAALSELDAKIDVYEKTVALHRTYAETESPRGKDRQSLKLAVEAIAKTFPSLGSQRGVAKAVLREVLAEVPEHVCRAQVEKVVEATRRLERTFAKGLPVKNLTRREGARAEMSSAHAGLRDDCPKSAPKLLQAAGTLVEDAGLILDHHEQLRRVGGVWRSPRARLSSSQVQLEQATLDVYRQAALFVASGAQG